MENQTTIALPLPAFIVGQRVKSSPDADSGLIIGIYYLLAPSPYDWDAGWAYRIHFDRLNPRTISYKGKIYTRQSYIDVLHESMITLCKCQEVA